jgi:hypothetical protein
MHTATFDLFKKDVHGNPVWLDSAADLKTARLRLTQLAVLPSEYFVFDQSAHRIVVSVVRLGSDWVQ